MDRRAQGRSQRLILRAHLAGVVQLRSREISRALSGRSACRRARAAFQTDAGHDPVRALTNRLLAAESFSNGENRLVAHGKIPFALFAAVSAVAAVLAQQGHIDTFGFSLPLRFEKCHR